MRSTFGTTPAPTMAPTAVPTPSPTGLDNDFALTNSTTLTSSTTVITTTTSSTELTTTEEAATELTTTEAAATAEGSLGMSCTAADKDLMCSEENLGNDGSTYLVLTEALSDSGVDTSSATISDLTCSGRRLTPFVRRLGTVEFSLDFVVSFADVSDATSFASSVDAVSEELQTSFEALVVAELGVNVTVTGVSSVVVADNTGSSSNGVQQMNVFSVAGAAITASLFSFW